MAIEITKTQQQGVYNVKFTHKEDINNLLSARSNSNKYDSFKSVSGTTFAFTGEWCIDGNRKGESLVKLEVALTDENHEITPIRDFMFLRASILTAPRDAETGKTIPLEKGSLNQTAVSQNWGLMSNQEVFDLLNTFCGVTFAKKELILEDKVFKVHNTADSVTTLSKEFVVNHTPFKVLGRAESVKNMLLNASFAEFFLTGNNAVYPTQDTQDTQEDKPEGSFDE